MKFYFRFLFLFTLIIHTSIVSNAQVHVVSPNNLIVGSGASCNFASLGNIELTETNSSDFNNNHLAVNYVITLPEGFEIDNPDATSINVTYEKISTGGTTTYTGGTKTIGFTGTIRNRFTFFYTIDTPSDDTARLVISGLRITCYQPGSYGHIYRTGGSAVQNGNAPSDKQSHGFLTSHINSFSATAYQYEYNYTESSNGQYSYFSSAYVPPSGTNLNPSDPRAPFCQVQTRLDFITPTVPGATYTLWDQTGQVTNAYTLTSGSNSIVRYYTRTTDSGNKDYFIRYTLNNCTYGSDTILVSLNTTPAKFTYDVTKDTSFQQDDDPVALNDYVIPPVSGTASLVGVAGTGINAINSQTTFLFLPGVVKTGTVYPYYVVEDNTTGCQAMYNFDKPLIVSDPLAALPNFIEPSKLPPYCANGSSFTIRFITPPGLPADSIMIGYYLSKKTGYVSSYNSLGLPDSPPITIDPIRDNYGSNLLYYSVTFKNTTTGTVKSHPGYIALFPERNPRLIGMPDPKVAGDSVVELCSSSKDTIFMRPNPSNGLLDIYISDATGSNFTAFGLASNFFSHILSETATNRYFIPEELFQDPDAANQDYNIRFKIRYIYPGSPYGQCPDTITRIIRFAIPVDVSHTINYPSAKPYCHGDTIKTAITYGASATYNSSDRYYWNFGDGLSAEEDSLLSISHYYSKPGRYLLRFKTLMNSLPPGYCNNDQLDTIQIGAKPIASFEVYKNFENQEANFVSTSSLQLENTQAAEDSIFLWEWNFGNGDTHISTLREDTIYQYTTTSLLPYPVSLHITSGWGCSHTLERPIPVFPIYQVTSSNTYTENFDTPAVPSGWFNSGDYRLPDTSSWLHGSPAVNSISGKYSGDNYWITSRNISNPGSVGYFNNEKSWVESPVMDITALEKPMVALDNWINADNLFDGAALQYALCDSVAFGDENWKTIGNTNLGLNWYNSFTVLGRPGNSLEGWTGEQDSEWKYSAYRLDDLMADLSSSNAKLVRFRVVWGSNPDNTPNRSFDGFAFDNFLVGQRNRQVLVEEFCDYQNFEPDIPVTLTDPQAIRLQYHVRTQTSNDEINNQNKAEPGARALLYGVGKALPRGIIDGIFSNNDQELMDWGPDAFFRRSLMISPFTISVSHSNNGGLLSINGTIEKNAIVATDVPGPFVVQIAMVETQVTGNGILFSNVLRKMLPNAAGHRIDENYDWNTPFTVSENFSALVTPESDYLAVIFIQDENTKEIYQSNFIVIPQADVPVTAASSFSLNGNPSSLISFDDLYLAPNPVSTEMKIIFNGPVPLGCSLKITDTMGNVVQTEEVASGTTALLLQVNDLNAGMYQLNITSPSQNLVKSFHVIR